MRKYLLIVLTIWGLQACSDSEDGVVANSDGTSTDSGKEDDTSWNGEDMANQGDLCGEPSYEAVGWDEVWEFGALHYRFDGATDSCVGEVGLSVSIGAGDGTGVSMEGKLGSWSNTSCGLQETEVDLEAQLPKGNTVLSEIAQIWGDATYPGTWDDGQAAELKIAVEATQTVACQTRTTTLVPVFLTYGTTDGRITETTAPATIDVGYDAVGNVRTMQLWLSQDMNCASTTDVIPYNAKSCGVLEGVTIQFGITEDQDGQMQVRDEGLMVYEYHRDGDAPPGAADHVATFALD